MKHNLAIGIGISIILLFTATAANAQPDRMPPPTIHSQTRQNAIPPRTISVSGSAEKLVDADRLYVNIGYGEYWEEEFEDGKEWKDFKTKVSIGNLEPQIIKSLNKLGFEDEDIVVKSAGNNYRQQGKDFLIKKTLELKIEDFSKMNEILAMMDMRGIDNINIGRMELDDIENKRVDVKVEALEAAKYKAEQMVGVYGEKLGRVLSISEAGATNYQPSYLANRMMASDQMESANRYESPLDNYKKMRISQQVNVIFLIK